MIDLGGKELQMGFNREICIPLLQPPQPVSKPRVQLVEAIHIPPKSEVLAMASTEAIEEGTYLLESSASRTGAAVARALVKLERGGRVPVSLLNPRSEAVTIRSGATIATLEPVESPAAMTVASVAPNSATPEQEGMLWQLVEESGEELTVGEKEQLFVLLLQNADIFAASKSDLGRTSQLSHTINTGQACPVRQRV